MKTFDELILVNYCYPDCIPLKNIMRLPKKKHLHWLLHLQNYIRKLQLFIGLQILKIIMHYEKNKMNIYIHDSLNQAVRRKKNIHFLL